MARRTGGNKLETLISDLDKLQKVFDGVFDVIYDKIVASVFHAIGEATAFDTGVARSLVQGVLRDLGHSDMADDLYPVVYEFWNTVEKRLKSNPTYELKKVRGSYSVTIVDYGFSNQAVDGYVSELHPRSNSGIHPNQVDFAIDLLETGSDRVIERAFVELENAIIQAIERGV